MKGTFRRALCLPALGFLAFGMTARAATFTVSTTADSGIGSLRQAVADANAGPDADTIVFSPGMAGQTVSLTTAADNTYGSSALVVTTPITIIGPTGSSGVTIARSASGGAMRLFYVPAGGSLTLRYLTLTGGMAHGGDGANSASGGGGGGGGLGGAVFNEGSLGIFNCTLSGNNAIGGNGGNGGDTGGTGFGGGPNGGAGDNGAGNGYAGGFGGGGAGGLNYYAGLPGFGGFGGPGGVGGGGGGGGADNNGSYAPITGAFAGSNEGGGGGGMGLGGAVLNKGGSVSIVNSTLAGNSTQGGSGGVSPTGGGTGANGAGFGGAVLNYNGTLTVLNSTLSANTGYGGVYNLGDGNGKTGSVTLNNALLSDYGDQAFNGGSLNAVGTNNLIQQSSDFSGGAITGQDPKLGPLQNNGGPTATMALLPGSPAIDAGDDASAASLTADQRATLVPRKHGAHVDIGACEGNTAPVSSGQNAVASQGTATLLTLAASDADGDALAYAFVTGVQHGTLSAFSGNQISYTPAGGYYGPDSFTFQVSDPYGGVSNTATVSIAVDAVPVTANQSVIVNQDASKTITLSASDADGDSQTYSIVTAPSHGSLGPVSGNQVVYTPTAGYHGADGFTFRSTDAHGVASNTATVSITVNGTPTATAQSVVVSQNGTATITLAGTDPENGALTFAIASSPAHGTLGTVNGNKVTYTPSAAYYGPDSFTFTATDPSGATSGAATVTINVNGVPVASGQSVEVNQANSVTIHLVASDPENGPLTYSIVTNAAHGDITLLGGSAFGYAVGYNYYGPDSFTFKATDAQGADSNVATVNVMVNGAPKAASQSFAVFQGGSRIITLSATDPEGDSFTYNVTGQPAHGTLGALNGNQVFYTPDPNYAGTDSFLFNAVDSKGAVGLNGRETVNIVTRAAFVVTTTADTSGQAGSVSLRDAVQTANSLADPAGTAITFSPSLAGQTVSLTQIGDGTFGRSALGITAPVAIYGLTTGGGITISRNASAPLMRLFTVVSGGSLKLQGLTLSGGVAQGGVGGGGRGGGGGGAGLGGAIFSQGALTIDGCTLVGNQAVGGQGGDNDRANYAGGGGGGLGTASDPGNGGVGYHDYNLGYDVPGNGGANGGGYGGAYNQQGFAGGFGGGGGGGSATFYNFYPGGMGGFGGGGGAGASAGFGGGDGGNHGGDPQYGLVGGGCGGGGAGLGGAVFNNGGTVTITNSTFSGNYALGGSPGSLTTPVNGAGKIGGGFGGGVFNRNGALTIVNSTFAANTAKQGGGVYSLGDGAAATASLTNTILSNTLNGTTDFQAGTVNNGTSATSGGSNIITSQSGFTGGIASTTDPYLGALASNGGPTQTMAPAADSAAVDGGDDSVLSAPFSLSTDQRGSGFNRKRGQHVDIGALENQNEQVPTAYRAAATAYQDTPGAISLAATDPQGRPLTYSIVSGTAHGTLGSPNGNQVVYTPTAGYHGPDSFTFQAAGAGGASNVATETVYVDASPLAAGPGAGTALHFGGGAYVNVPNFGAAAPTTEVTIEFWQKAGTLHDESAFVLSPDDTDNRINAHVPLSNGSVFWDFGNIGDGSGRLVYTPPSGQPVVNGTWEHWAFVASASQNFQGIYRNGVLVAGKTGPSSFAQVAGAALHIGSPAATGNQGDLDEFRVWNTARTAAQIQDGMTHPPAGGEAGLVGYWRFNEATGTVARDNSGHGLDGTLMAGTTWEASPVSESGVLNVSPATPITGTVSGGDLESEPLTFSLVTGAGKGTVAITDAARGIFQYTPNGAASGADSFTFRASDGHTFSAPATVSLNVAGPNHAPVANAQSVSLQQDTSKTIILTGDDADTGASSLAYSIASQPAHGTLGALNGAQVTYTPNAGYSGPDAFTFTATDPSGAVSSAATVSITVNALPAPTATTGFATGVSQTGATLNGAASPNGFNTTTAFQWGTDTSYGNSTAPQGVGSGTAAVPFSQALAGLTPGTTYHYRATASSAGGTANGADSYFVTLLPYSGTALHFGGTGSVTVPGFGNSAPTGEITVEFWQKVDSARQQSTFATSPLGTNRINAHVPWDDGNVYWDFGDVAGNGRLAYTPPAANPIHFGQWEHWAFVASVSQNFMSIYRNGVQVASRTGAAAFAQDPSRDLSLAALGFQGDLDEFRVWNVARTAAQIQAAMRTPLTGNETGLVAYYRFDEGAGLTVSDATGHGYAGALQNNPLWIASDAFGQLLYGYADAARALRIAAGLTAAGSADLQRLDVETGSASAGHISLADALRITRKAAAKDPNP